jgi:hypothetical protein
MMESSSQAARFFAQGHGDLGFLGIGRRPLIWIYLSKELRYLSQN